MVYETTRGIWFWGKMTRWGVGGVEMVLGGEATKEEK